MVVGEASIHNIMGGMESTGGVRLHNHKRKLKQRFDIIKKLGQGTYGKVQLGINKETGQEVAIKTIKKCKIETEADLIRIRREIQIMSSVQHPNIIHIYEVFENREKMVLVMEYAAGGELFDYLSERNVLPEEETRRIFRQISIAVFYCHKHKICHRDLKLENILLDQLGNAKIADFGLSNVFDDQRLLNTFCGSPLYASPEIVKGTPYHGPEVDCWSLGVLLYTLVYGAMPFDGSNFKRLTRQISASDYFEPKNPSPASPLIKDMLTKCPSRRADIERICSHWWVNEGYEQNCLDIAEELAAQTPVRLDLLLSLVPQSASADKLVVTNDQQQSATNTNVSSDALVPTRCHSVGSLMELDRNNTDCMCDINDNNNEQQARASATSDTKRKLETTPSMEETGAANVKRKERSRRKERNDDREQKPYRSSSRHHSAPIANAITEEAMELDLRDPAAAAACLELIREAQSKSPSKERSRTPVVPEKSNIDVTNVEKTVTIQNVNENNEDIKPVVNKLTNTAVSEKISPVDEIKNHVIDECQLKNKSPKSKLKDITPNNDVPKSDGCNNSLESEISNGKIVTSLESEKIGNKGEVKKKQRALSLDSDESPAVPPAKPTERRRSKIFETAEKFNQLAAGTETEKPKKIFIPGVNVGGAKKVFERKASLSSINVSPPIKPNASKVIIDVPTDKKNDKIEEKSLGAIKVEPTKTENEQKRDEQKKRAVDIITGALGKPPVQKKLNGSPPMTPQSQDAKKALGLKIQVGPNDVRNATVSVTTPVDTKYPDFDQSPVKPVAIGNSVPSSPEVKPIKNSLDEPMMSSKMEITLKSATLPRPRKTSKAEIILASGVKTPEAAAAFKSEVEAKIDAFHPQKLRTQKSEVAFPVAAVIPQANRSSSLEPEGKMKAKERIIPIHVEPGHQSPPQQHSSTSSLPSKPPMPQRSMSQRSGSLSRQSTMDSDTDSALGSTIGPEPIRKSPREYIIPIAVEGGSYVTPRSSVEPESKTGTTTSSTNPSKTRFGRPRRMGSLLSDASEDESPFSTLHRDSDDLLQRHMHRLRSSRPTRQASEHADSLSSGEDDDDDGFELLTAENLFSTLLSRVRSLTQRLNVDDNRGTGFPRSRLLDRLGTNSSQGFWGLHEPLSRRMPESPFRRSLSRDTERFGRKDSAMSSAPGTPNSLGGRNSTPSRESIFEMGSSNTLPRDNIHRNESATETDSSRMRKELSQDVQLPESSGTSSHENFTPSLARRLSRQFIEQTRHALPRSPSIPRDRLYRSSTEEPTSSLTSTLLPERSEYRSRSSDRNIRRTNSLLDAKRPERPDYRSTRRSVSLFADDDDDDELLSPMPRQVMTLGRKYRDPVKPSSNGIRRDIFSRTEKIQEESHDELNSPRKIVDSNSEVTLEPASISEGTSICNSNPNLGDTLSTLSTKSCETSSTESTSNNQGEALNSFKADAKDFESRLLAAENLIKESKLRNLGVNRFDPNLKSSYKDMDKCDKEFLGSMTDLTNSVLSKRRSCIPSLRLRSGSLTRESSNSYDRRPPLVGSGDAKDIRAPTPERSLLSKLFRSSSTSRDSENKDKSPKTRRRISRFLRPDFFDTPREESQYVKEKEAQKAAENERRKARFMKKKVGSKEASIEKSVSVEEKPEKELKNEANALTRDKNDAPKDNKSDNDSSSIIIANTDAKLERQNSKNSFLQSLEKKLEKLRSNDSDSSKINNDDDNEKVSVTTNEENKTTLMTPVKETETNSEILKKAASIDDPSSSINEPSVTTTKSRVSSVLGLFRNDSKSTINGTRQQNNILSKFKKSAYKGSRSDSIVLTGEPSAGSKIPTKSTKVESKSPRRSLESKKSPEKSIEIKKSPPKEKSKEKTPTERLSVERKLSVDRQVKSPKKLSPEKSTDVKGDKNEKSNIKDPSVEKDIQRKSSSPEKNDSKNSFTARLTKKSSPDKVLDNKKSEIKNTDNEDKKLVKVKKTVKSLTSLTKNGSITKLEKDDESDKKIKKVVKKESADKEGVDGTKKKKIVRVVKKVVKKSDGSSDSKSEEKEKSTTKTLLKKITSSTKKENSPESIEKNKEKSSTDINNKKKEKSPVTKIIEENDSTNVKIDTPATTTDTKISTKESDNKLRTNRSNLKLDLSKIPQHSFKTSGNTKKESPKLNSTDHFKSEISEKPQENFSKMTHHANITGNKIIIDKPLRAADIAQLQRESDTQIKLESNKTINPPKVETEFKIQPNIESQINLKINRTDSELKDKPSPLQENPKQYTNKIPQQKITSDYAEDILSPMDDGESFDSWSICSNDMNHRGSMDLHSPTSPTYSPSTRNDHPESIIDRIRRKSFYSRFNERKRKSSLNVPPPGITLPTSSTLPRKYSFHSSRDTERSRRNYSISPTRRSSDRVYSLYNDDTSTYRKSPIERDRYSDVGSSLSSFSGELKSPGDQYGSGSTSYYDPLSRYRISPIPDSTHRKYPSTDFGLDSDLTSYKSPMSPSALNDGISDYRSTLSRRYGSVASGLAPKTAEYYEELLAPSRIDYLSARRTPVPGEYSGKYENGYHNGHSELSQSSSDKWRGYSDKISGLDSAEDSDPSRGDDIRINSQVDGESKELSAACPDTDNNTSIVE